MADILLSGGTCRSNPFVKNWFDQFRIVTDNIEAEGLQQEAMYMDCTILHENRCYCEDGSVHEICHELSMDALKKFLCDWKECVNVRVTNIGKQGSKYTLVKKMDKQAKTLANLEAEQSALHFRIR